MPAVPALVTFAVTTWGIGSASFWRDEAATLSATRRPLPDLIAMLGHVDAVHGAYYLLMWPLAHVVGVSEVVMRLPSAVAMAAAAGGVAAGGRRLGSWQAGLCSGLVFAALPMTSRYGQEARSYALVTAAAVLASYLLVRVITTPGRRWLVGYGLSLAALGSLNIFGLLIVPAHAVTLAATRRRPTHGSAGGEKADGGREPAGGGEGDGADPGTGVLRGWLIAVAAAVVGVSPVALFAWRERAQFAWLLNQKPGWQALYALVTGLTGSVVSFALIAALSVLAVLGGGRRDHARLGRRDHARLGGRRLAWLGAPWLIVPPALLFAVSQVDPAYQLRYLVFCVPAVAILAGAGLAEFTRYWGIAALVALVALVALALPSQISIREPAGHGDNIRAAAQVLQARARPADDVIYDDPGTRTDSLAYPYGFTGLRDISLLTTPSETQNLGGTQVSPRLLASRLAGARRVWLIEVAAQPQVPPVMAAMPFRRVRAWQIGAMTLWLYVRETPH